MYTAFVLKGPSLVECLFGKMNASCARVVATPARSVRLDDQRILRCKRMLQCLLVGMIVEWF